MESGGVLTIIHCLTDQASGSDVSSDALLDASFNASLDVLPATSYPPTYSLLAE